ncbi:reverse transcriptase domain-containing protein [Tanacetum coccineum]
MESVQDMSGCSINQKVKYTAGSFMGKALAWWNSQIRTLSREVAVSMSWNDFKLMMIKEFCPSHEMEKLETELWNHAMVGVGHATYTDRFHELARRLYIFSGAPTDEVVRNGSIKKVEKQGHMGEPNKDKNGKDDNKKTRTGNDFATTANHVGSFKYEYCKNYELSIYDYFYFLLCFRVAEQLRHVKVLDLGREEFCPSHEMQKLETELWNHVMVGAGYAAYTNRFHELARLVPHLVTQKSRKIERYVHGLAPHILRDGGNNEQRLCRRLM